MLQVSQAEVVNKRSNRIHRTWGPPLSRSCSLQKQQACREGEGTILLPDTCQLPSLLRAFRFSVSCAPCARDCVSNVACDCPVTCNNKHSTFNHPQNHRGLPCMESPKKGIGCVNLHGLWLFRQFTKVVETLETYITWEKPLVEC